MARFKMDLIPIVDFVPIVGLVSDVVGSDDPARTERFGRTPCIRNGYDLEFGRKQKATKNVKNQIE